MRWLPLLLLLPTASLAASHGTYAVQEDTQYEQALRYDGMADKDVTPARFLRWARSLAGSDTEPTHESSWEFRPIVKASETTGKRVLARIAYKF